MDDILERETTCTKCIKKIKLKDAFNCAMCFKTFCNKHAYKGYAICLGCNEKDGELDEQTN